MVATVQARSGRTGPRSGWPTLRLPTHRHGSAVAALAVPHLQPNMALI